jgi:hypothetical protein
MRHEPTGLDRWANTDTSLHFNHSAPRRNGPTWQGSWMWCLRFNDEESAHLIRVRNDERYAERCEREAASVFPMEAPRLVSLSEAQSERNESEAA